MDDTEPLAIYCSNLVKRYLEVVAVNGLTLEVKKGECFGLLGPNGAGKTTAVEILEGLVKPDCGTIRIFGQSWGNDNGRALRERFAVQLQETQFSERLSVLETVQLFRSFYKFGKDPEEIIRLLELNEKQYVRVGHLSGGQKQRLAIACALVSNPEILFLDEPTTGLDPQARLKLWGLLEKFGSRGGTTLLTTHSMEEASRLCDRIAIMDHGKVIAINTPVALIESLGTKQIIEFKVEGQIEEEIINKFPGVQWNFDQNGIGLLTVSSAGEAIKRILFELGKCNANIIGVTSHQGTLEDVFVKLTGRSLRDV